jgi:predicted nucleic acid-binding protein
LICIKAVAKAPAAATLNGHGTAVFFCDAIAHLLGMRHVTVERWEAVNDAVDLHRRGLEFADALHLTSSRACSQFASFDDRRFVRRARRLKLSPEVVVPK